MRRTFHTQDSTSENHLATGQACFPSLLCRPSSHRALSYRPRNPVKHPRLTLRVRRRVLVRVHSHLHVGAAGQRVSSTQLPATGRAPGGARDSVNPSRRVVYFVMAWKSVITGDWEWLKACGSHQREGREVVADGAAAQARAVTQARSTHVSRAVDSKGSQRKSQQAAELSD